MARAPVISVCSQFNLNSMAQVYDTPSHSNSCTLVRHFDPILCLGPKSFGKCYTASILCATCH